LCIRDWLSGRCALFRDGPLRKNYLSTGNADASVAWDRATNKGHLFAANFGDAATAALRYEAPQPHQFANIPIIDYTAPNREQVHRILKHAGFMTGLHGRVFMHCAGGWGRTGMGLLLSVMALYDLDWPTGMKLMYQLYKRQSIEEVAHLLHASIEKFDTIERLLRAAAAASNPLAAVTRVTRSDADCASTTPSVVMCDRLPWVSGKLPLTIGKR
jgi:hypothetical protein